MIEKAVLDQSRRGLPKTSCLMLASHIFVVVYVPYAVHVPVIYRYTAVADHSFADRTTVRNVQPSGTAVPYHSH